jgi:mRNA interferase RelE/StbE
MATVWIDPAALRELRLVPGHMRQRIRVAVAALADDPRPDNARQLGLSQPAAEAWRLRIDRWRVVYTIEEDSRWVGVWAIRRRPPYNYEDLDDLIDSS